jgi:hypothetical protein
MDYPGLKGRDLTPKGKITEIHSKDSDKEAVKPGKSDKAKFDPGVLNY